jgi:hypothetical protein
MSERGIGQNHPKRSGFFGSVRSRAVGFFRFRLLLRRLPPTPSCPSALLRPLIYRITCFGLGLPTTPPGSLQTELMEAPGSLYLNHFESLLLKFLRIRLVLTQDWFRTWIITVAPLHTPPMCPWEVGGRWYFEHFVSVVGRGVCQKFPSLSFHQELPL